jgi:hypothetical protein
MVNVQFKSFYLDPSTFYNFNFISSFLLMSIQNQHPRGPNSGSHPKLLEINDEEALSRPSMGIGKSSSSKAIP